MPTARLLAGLMEKCIHALVLLSFVFYKTKTVILYNRFYKNSAVRKFVVLCCPTFITTLPHRDDLLLLISNVYRYVYV